MDRKLLDECNELLKKELGLWPDGRPMFRIVWSTGITEKRYGTYRDFYGKIFVREYVGVREVLKYPYDQDRFILERLEPCENNELQEMTSYEPIYVFKDKRGFFLPLNRKVVEFYINALRAPYDRSKRKAEIEAEDERAQAEEVAEFMDVLDNEGPTPLFAYKDAVFIDSTKRKVE